MKLSGYFHIPLCALLLSLAFSEKATSSTTIFDESSKDFHQNRFNLETNYRYFLSDANYTTSGGQYVSLPTGNKYQVSDLDFGMRWTTGTTWGLYTRARLSQAESRTNGVTRTNSNISQVAAGVDMLLVSNSHFDVIPDLSFIFPLQRVAKNADEVLTGEGDMEGTARLIGRLKWGTFQPFATAGITYRDEGRSTLLPFSAGAELKLSDFYIGADIGGYQTLIKDQYTNNPAERNVVSIRDGGSLKYYSVDPSLVESSAWIRWKGPQFGIRGGAATTVTGSNTATGMTFFAGLTFAMDSSGKKQRSLPPPMEAEVHSDDEVQKFEETVNDGVDQNLFRKPAPLPRPKPVKRPDPAQQRQKMQNELDQTEMQIELKKTSKKKRKN